MEEKILEKLGRAPVLEQLAEEDAEVAQAALKLARIIRGENPTPKTSYEAEEALEEEMADVSVCMRVLAIESIVIDVENVEKIAEIKMKRWLNRLENMRG
jgi:NTP pyrophosphatase (non-canonical NTP hydrolase)